jgi:hypothetical protein
VEILLEQVLALNAAFSAAAAARGGVCLSGAALGENPTSSATSRKENGTHFLKGFFYFIVFTFSTVFSRPLPLDLAFIVPC